MNKLKKQQKTKCKKTSSLCFAYVYSSDRVLSDDEEEEEEEEVEEELPSRGVKYDLLTPCSKVKTAQELIIRAKELEKYGDLQQALIDYREGKKKTAYFR